MLNPNEIANKRFDKSMGRYKCEDVEHYLSQLAGDVDSLLADKRDQEEKLMVLADKLEEYKHDEESLRAALLGAQKLGDSVVREAKAKAERIIDDANAQANLMLENARRAIEKEQASFVRMQREVATFKSKLQLLYKQHLELITSIPVDDNILNPVPPKPAPVVEPEPEIPAEPEAMYDIHTSAETVEESAYLPEDLPAPALEYAEQPLDYSEDIDYLPPSGVSEQEPDRVRRESRFGPLKFGKEFDIKRDTDKRKK